jgi:hypothetical protein
LIWKDILLDIKLHTMNGCYTAPPLYLAVMCFEASAKAMSL